MVWAFLILIGSMLVYLIAQWYWIPRLEETTIGWSLWQLPLWFAVGAVPTYLVGVVCYTFKGYDGWSNAGAIAGGFLAGFGVMTLFAVPVVDLALGVPRRRALYPIVGGGPGGRWIPIALGLGIATLPLWWPNRLAGLGTPELRHHIVQQLQSPDDSTRLEAADRLADFGTPDEIPALETALKKAQQSGDRELEQKCHRALERIRRR